MADQGWGAFFTVALDAGATVKAVEIVYQAGENREDRRTFKMSQVDADHEPVLRLADTSSGKLRSPYGDESGCEHRPPKSCQSVVAGQSTALTRYGRQPGHAPDFRTAIKPPPARAKLAPLWS
jgi:hypothetical protein